MNVIDLFGEPVTLAVTMSTNHMGVVVPKRKPTKANGYADKPGSGPEGETCGTCKHCVFKRMAGSYPKCAVVKESWTSGTATDIRLKSAACSKWETKYRKMTPDEWFACHEFIGVRLLPGSSMKRFINSMIAEAKGDAMISPKQSDYLRLCVDKFKRQLPDSVVAWAARQEA